MKRRNTGSVRFFRLSDMGHLELVYGTRVANDFPRHVHNSLCIGVVDQGTRTIWQDGKSTSISEDGFFVINPGTQHRCGSLHREGHNYRIICVDPEVVAAVASQISGRVQPMPHFTQVSLSEKPLVQKVREFFSLTRYSDSLLERESVFVSLLSELILRYGDKVPTGSRVGRDRAAIRRVCEFVKANYAETPSLEQLARLACLSPFHFQRVFLKQVGISPHDYLIRCRIARARELLLKGHSIVKVALEVGFYDQSHFTRCFTRVVGIPPGRYLCLHTVSPESFVSPRGALKS